MDDHHQAPLSLDRHDRGPLPNRAGGEGPPVSATSPHHRVLHHVVHPDGYPLSHPAVPTHRRRRSTSSASSLHHRQPASVQHPVQAIRAERPGLFRTCRDLPAHPVRNPPLAETCAPRDRILSTAHDLRPHCHPGPLHRGHFIGSTLQLLR